VHGTQWGSPLRSYSPQHPWYGTYIRHRNTARVVRPFGDEDDRQRQTEMKSLQRTCRAKGPFTPTTDAKNSLPSSHAWWYVLGQVSKQPWASSFVLEQKYGQKVVGHIFARPLQEEDFAVSTAKTTPFNLQFLEKPSKLTWVTAINIYQRNKTTDVYC
jgi:hypothetical protein